MQTQFNELLQKRMDRKDFLKHVGIGLVALTGATTVLKAFTPALDSSQLGQQAQSGYGYGTSVYGGNKPAQSASTLPRS